MAFRLTLRHGQSLSRLQTSSFTGTSRNSSASRFEDVVSLFDRVKAAVGAFQEFAHEQLIGGSDAGSQLSGILESELPRFPVNILPRHVKVLGSDGSHEQAEIAPPVMLELDHTLLSAVATSCSAAIICAGKEIEAAQSNQREGFYPGSAFSSWLLSMRDWAKRRGLPYDARDKESASPLRDSSV